MDTYRGYARARRFVLMCFNSHIINGSAAPFGWCRCDSFAGSVRKPFSFSLPFFVPVLVRQKLPE